MRSAPARLLLAAALLLVGCSDATTGPDSRVVAGVDLDVLFAPPTAAELAAVEADWASRDVDAVEVDVEHDTTVALDTLDLRVRIVSHRAGGVLHYGAVIRSEALSAPAPTLVYAHGGDTGVAIDDVFLLLPFLGDAPAGFVWVIPSFRSESVRLGSRSWTSEGPASPWDLDVDDALSLLDATFDLEPLADSTRVGVIGFSRGAGVGLLMGIRDERIDRILEFFGPTDFFGPFVQDVTEEALRGSPRELPGLEYLDETYVQPLARGEITTAAMRAQLVRRSSVLFAEQLPVVEVHHGTADAVVDVSQARALIDAMDAIGRGEPDFRAFLYEGGTHNPLSLVGSIPRAVEFLEGLR